MATNDEVVYEVCGVDVREIDALETIQLYEYIKDAVGKIGQGLLMLTLEYIPDEIVDIIDRNGFDVNILNDLVDVVRATEEQVSNMYYWESAFEEVLDYGDTLYGSAGEDPKVRRQALS